MRVRRALLRTEELLALGSRIRTRLLLGTLEPEELEEFLTHALEEAGAPHLMTPELKRAAAELAGGNLRTLCAIGLELLDAAAARKLPSLDEKLFFETFKADAAPRRARDGGRRP